MTRRTAPGGPAGGRNPSPGYLAVGAGVCGLGLFFIAGAYLLRVLPGYARISPRFFPVLVGLGLLGAGALLLREGWRGEAPGEPGSGDWRAASTVAGALVAYVLLLERVGFILASAALLAASAYGLGSRRLVANGVVGLVVAAAAYLLFTRTLGLPLPAGILG